MPQDQVTVMRVVVREAMWLSLVTLTVLNVLVTVLSAVRLMLLSVSSAARELTVMVWAAV